MNRLHFPGKALEEYRAQTGRQAPMPGATAPSFICKSCGHSRKTAGRKQVVKGYSKAGWMCAQCAGGHGH